MAGKKENLKALFTNTRSRVIIIFTLAILILAVLIGVFRFMRSGSDAGLTDVTSAPNIQSIPGALNPTAQYAKLQENQNENQASAAMETGASSIPTIIRSQTIGSGVDVVGAKEGHSGVGFSGLNREDEAGAARKNWIDILKKSNCDAATVREVVKAGATVEDLKQACTCKQLKDRGYGAADLQRVCNCSELKIAGLNIKQLKDAGFTVKRLIECGYSACEVKSAGFSAQEMLDGGFSPGELKGSGFTEEQIARASGIPDGMTADDIRRAGCSVSALAKLRSDGVTVSAIRRISGCPPEQLKAAGYTAVNLRDAGFPASTLKNLFTPAELRQAGFSAKDLIDAGIDPKGLAAAGYSTADIQAGGSDLPPGFAPKGRTANCSVASLTAARKAGVSATTIRKTLGCSAAAMKAAGFTAKELKDAGFTAAELKAAGFSAKELKDAGFTAKELKDAGFTAAQLKDAGFSAKELKNAGFSAQQLKAAGLTADDLKAAGFSPEELVSAGITSSEVAGLKEPTGEEKVSSTVPIIPVVQKIVTPESAQQANIDRIKEIQNRQKQQLADQKYQQKIQQRSSEMLSSANQSVQDWKKVSTQAYIEGNDDQKKEGSSSQEVSTSRTTVVKSETTVMEERGNPKIIVKTGDILFAVIDTSVNSDEPGPILATIVSGKLKGARLIGSFQLPPNADKMVITFNTLSVRGAPRSIPINAYAIDPNTARTALSSRTNHHFLIRYGSLFASSFLEGIGNAFQSADTTVTVAGAGGNGSVTVQNGIGRSTLQNAVIALNAVGKAWGQAAQQVFATPTTVEVYSGVGIGVLFTQDLTTL